MAEVLDSKGMIMYIEREKALRYSHIEKAATAAKYEGRIAGRVIGESQAKLEMASNLLARGLEHSKVAELTGLDVKALLTLNANAS